MTPTAMFMVERPRTKAAGGRMSDISAIMLPPVADMTSHGMASRMNRAHQASPGTAWRRFMTSPAEATSMSARRGRSRSDRERRNVDPRSRTSGPPNMLRAVRTGELVAAKVMVPRARLLAEAEATVRHCSTKRTRNSRIARSWR